MDMTVRDGVMQGLKEEGESRLVDSGPESMSAKKAVKVAAGARPVQGRPPLP